MSGKNLLAGVFPTRDHLGHMFRVNTIRSERAGQPLAGNWKAGFEAWCGDWKERSLSHMFIRRNFQSTYLCDQCDAIAPHKRTPDNLLPYIYTNFAEDAPWTQTLRTHEQYLASTPSANLSPWLELPGFHISCVRWDVAHTVLLGTGKDIVGSFLCDLAPSGFIQ